jgi:hypothetical protein
MKLLKYVVYSLLLIGGSVQAQTSEKYTLSGTIKDASNGEELIGAVLGVVELPSVGVASNTYGFYSITLPKGKYTFYVSYVGFQKMTVAVDLNQNTSKDWLLQGVKQLKEVVVNAEKKGDNIRRAEMGVERLDMKEIAKLPVIFGEKDLLKTLQLLPGVKSAGEGNSGFYVRGGAADQNLILLDEAPVYNASHLLGFFSTFNSDAIKDVSLIKGNSPAQYGGRLSSVLDVKMKEGNNQNYNVTGGVGLISSRLSVEGPIQKDKSSFIISGRRTYADLFLKASDDFKDNKLYFYDLNAKVNYKINSKNRIFASGYFGRDVLGFGDNFGIDWGNRTATIRWNSIINPKLFSNTSVIYSDYDYRIKVNSGGTSFNIDSKIKDWNLKQEFQYFANAKNSLRFGFNSIYHNIIPSTFEDGTDDAKEEGRYSLENAIFVNNTARVSSRLNLDYGLRLSIYSILGGDTYNKYDKGVLTDSVVLKDGEFGKTYYNLEPRFSASYILTDASSVKAAYSRNTQHLHLLSNSTSSTPTDQWIGNSYNIKPEISDQISLGYFRNFNQDKYEFSVETYYKDMQNQVDYKDGADINTSADVESELLYGKGRAYGIEFLVKKKTGKFSGWIGYTLSRTERKIDGINNNEWYLARQDRTHDISLVALYQLTDKWALSGLFVYNTGNAVTFPSGKYAVEGVTTFYYTERNGYRMPAYHRMDLGATYEPKSKGRFQGTWSFSLYNVYGRENAYTITFEDDPNNAGRTRAMQTALFRWVPSVTYNFKF